MKFWVFETPCFEKLMMEGAAMGSVRVDESDTMLEESELLDLVKKKENAQPANPELPGEDPMVRVGGLIARSRSWSYGYRVWPASYLRQSPQPHRIYTSRNTTLEQFHLHRKAGVRTLAFRTRLPMTQNASLL